MSKGHVILTEVVRDEEGMQAYAEAAARAMSPDVRVLDTDAVILAGFEPPTG